MAARDLYTEHAQKHCVGSAVLIIPCNIYCLLLGRNGNFAGGGGEEEEEEVSRRGGGRGFPFGRNGRRRLEGQRDRSLLGAQFLREACTSFSQGNGFSDVGDHFK